MWLRTGRGGQGLRPAPQRGLRGVAAWAAVLQMHAHACCNCVFIHASRAGLLRPCLPSSLHRYNSIACVAKETKHQVCGHTGGFGMFESEPELPEAVVQARHRNTPRYATIANAPSQFTAPTDIFSAASACGCKTQVLYDSCRIQVQSNLLVRNWPGRESVATAGQRPRE